jgi:hypothetical protein
MSEPAHADDLDLIPLDGDRFIRVPRRNTRVQALLEQRQRELENAALHDRKPRSTWYPDEGRRSAVYG